MKYNIKLVMRHAWAMYRLNGCTTRDEFAIMLKQSWVDIKAEAADYEKRCAHSENERNGVKMVVSMHYGEYKRNLSGCPTVVDSYNKNTKYISVIIPYNRYYVDNNLSYEIYDTNKHVANF